MNATMQQVVADIREVVWHESGRVYQRSTTLAPLVAEAMCMTMNWRVISTRIPPLREDLLQRLQNEIAGHPVMLKATDYPENIIRWIEEHLCDWEDGDWLGLYMPSQKAVDLYSLSIVLCARRHSWDISDLTFVVHVHELAHACSHLGRDSNGQNWDTDSFSRQTGGVVEGLAQYWTHYVLMGQAARKKAALEVFLGLMKGQPAPYRSHMTWLEEKCQEIYQSHGISPVKDLETTLPFHRSICENVRTAMIIVRKVKTSPSVRDFTDLLDLPGVAASQVTDLF